MTSARTPTRFILPCVFAGAALAAFFFFMPDVAVKPVEPKTPAASVSLLPASGEVSADSAKKVGLDEIKDFAPMFIPTRWNVSFASPEIPKTSTWSIFESNVDSALPEREISPIVGDVSDAANDRILIFMRNAFSAFGRGGVSIEPLSLPRTVVIRNLRDGSVVLKRDLSRVDAPEGLSIAEFYLRKSGGFFQTPVLKSSSGDEKLDSELSDTLRGLSDSLPEDGDYKALITP